jgi:phosphomannomutase/phosphoglucomutase
VAETELTADFVQVLGEACGRLFREAGESRVVVGRDNRLSSERIFHDLTMGLAAAGCEILDLGVTVTPIFYYARIHWEINAGVMITASHNPGEFNGFKITLGPGTLYGDTIQKLRVYSETIGAKWSNRPHRPKITTVDPSDAYIRMVEGKIRLGERRLKIAVDCGNGAAGGCAGPLFSRLGCEPLLLYAELDGRFPNHHPNPVKERNLRDLAERVKREGCDLGVAFDGDRDRLGVVDECGRMIRADRLMVLFWREILVKHPGADCIIEVKCSQALVDEVERLGGRACFYKTGHSFIKAKMRELGAPFAGEMSGHMFFADEYYGYDDALYAAARLLRILSKTELPLSRLLMDLPDYPSTGETHIPCSDQAKFRVVRELTERLRRRFPLNDVDGVRVVFPEGWALARASNTEPAIVARCEGMNGPAFDGICRLIKGELASFPEVGEFEWER